MFHIFLYQKLSGGMCFIQSFLQMCLYSNIYDAISHFRKSENKNTVPDTCYIINDRAIVIKFMNVRSNSTQCKKQKYKKLVSQKESLENADLYKPVLNKIMTTHKYFLKYNSVALLKGLYQSQHKQETTQIMEIKK